MRDMNMDMRVIRTKEAIRTALVELIEEKGFEAMTVKDITTRAKINRATFYTHYQDKYDLLTKCEEEIMHEMVAIAKKDFPDVIADLGTNPSTTTPLRIAISIFEFLNENRGFMKAVLGPKGDLSFQIKLKEFMWKTLFESNQNPFIKQENLLVPGEYLVSYVSSAHIGVIQRWLNSDGKESPLEMARILSTITVNGAFFAAGLKKS